MGPDVSTGSRNKCPTEHSYVLGIREASQTHMHNCALTANETPAGLLIHLGGFFRGGINDAWATCSGTCNGGRGWPLLKEEEI